MLHRKPGPFKDIDRVVIRSIESQNHKKPRNIELSSTTQSLAVKLLNKRKSAGVNNILAEQIEAGREAMGSTLQIICKKICQMAVFT